MIRPLSRCRASAPRPRSCARPSPSMATPAGANAADQRSRPLPRLHQRQARRRRSADPGLDQLLGSPVLPDLRCRRPAQGRREHHRHLARRRLVPLAMMWPREPDPQHLGRARSAPSPSCDRPAARSCSRPTTAGRAGSRRSSRRGIYFGEIYDARAEDQPADRRQRRRSTASTRRRLIPHETNGVKELRRSPVAAQLRRCRGPHGLRLRPEQRRLCRLHRRGRARRARSSSSTPKCSTRTGKFYNANIRTAEARVEYILKGGGAESYRPTFTFFGFRYARVTIEGKARITSIQFDPDQLGDHARPATFTSAHPLVNRLVENTIWSQRAQLHRGADRLPAARRAPRLDRRRAGLRARPPATSHDSHGILVKYLRDVMADQRPDGAIPHVVPDPTRNHEDIVPGFYGSTGWGDAICIIPLGLYDALRRPRHPRGSAAGDGCSWNDFVWSISNGPIVRPPRELGRPRLHLRRLAAAAGRFRAKPYPTIGDDAAATIYLYISSALIAPYRRRSSATRRSPKRHGATRAERS